MIQPIFIKEFLPQQIFNIINNYCIIKYSNANHINLDPQSRSLIKEYSDPLMETILDMSTPVIEKNVGKSLFPTYSFFRIYDKLSDLKVHLDRPSCEYTVALCLGADPKDVPYNIFLGKENSKSDYKYSDETKNVPLEIEGKFEMLPNNALIFQGTDKFHWREECIHDHFITVFLHYVDQNGDFSNHKFDERTMLGQPKTK